MESMCGQPVPLVFRDPAAYECREWVLEAYPQLRELDPDAITDETWRLLLFEYEQRWGTEMEVAPLPVEAQEQFEDMVLALDPDVRKVNMREGWKSESR